MHSSRPSLPIHSLTEARLFTKITPCSNCGSGPLAIAFEDVRCDDDLLIVPVACRACRHPQEMAFETGWLKQPGPVSAMLDELRDLADLPAAQTINPSRDPSEIIDIAGWLTLHLMMAESARIVALDAHTLADRGLVRRLRIEAGHCLAEALKFYDDDNDLPPTDAFFSDAADRQFREHPELFVRQRLLHLRSQLPHDANSGAIGSMD